MLLVYIGPKVITLSNDLVFVFENENLYKFETKIIPFQIYRVDVIDSIQRNIVIG
jgi:hypothetical protein